MSRSYFDQRALLPVAWWRIDLPVAVQSLEVKSGGVTTPERPDPIGSSRAPEPIRALAGWDLFGGWLAGVYAPSVEWHGRGAEMSVDPERRSSSVTGVVMAPWRLLIQFIHSLVSSAGGQPADRSARHVHVRSVGLLALRRTAGFRLLEATFGRVVVGVNVCSVLSFGVSPRRSGRRRPPFAGKVPKATAAWSCPSPSHENTAPAAAPIPNRSVLEEYPASPRAGLWLQEECPSTHSPTLSKDVGESGCKDSKSKG